MYGADSVFLIQLTLQHVTFLCAKPPKIATKLADALAMVVSKVVNLFDTVWSSFCDICHTYNIPRCPQHQVVFKS